MKLLKRSEFRNGVFQRDEHKCVFCEKEAKDAHHILERRLWSDGGYYLSNGASVCEEHHIKCETTEISVEQVREACKIKKFRLPEHLYYDQLYDKWGNIILPNGQRLKGELFEDESVQKILEMGKVLHLFTPHVKYPRTFHLPWSPGMNKDDRVIDSTIPFYGRIIVITEKMDGENTTMYRDHIHARSVSSSNHPSRGWVKNFWSKIRYEIPENWRICGENLYAEHSISYNDLETYFLGFSIWNEKNECLDWDSTLEWFQLLGITPVRELHRGPFSQKSIEEATDGFLDWDKNEGYVVRTLNGFPMSQFKKSVAKYVRAGHVQTTKHWMHGQKVVKNRLVKNI